MEHMQPVHEVDTTRENVSPGKLASMLKKSLRYSFGVSQGGRQEDLMIILGAWYSGRFGANAITAAADTVETEQIRKFGLPSEHGPLEYNIDPKSEEGARRVAAQFDHFWNNGGGTLIHESTHPRFEYNPANPRCEFAMVVQLGKLIDRDIDYQQPTIKDAAGNEQPFSGRPARGPGNDPRKSFMREHVINSATIGDPVWDEILRDMRTLLLEGPVANFTNNSLADDPLHTTGSAYEMVKDKLSSLAVSWESYHPGEHFFSTIELPAVADQP